MPFDVNFENGHLGLSGSGFTGANGASAVGGVTFDPNAWSNYFKNQAAGRGHALPRYDTTNQDQARLAQQQVIQELQRQAAGDPNSRAQQQLAQGYGAAQSQQSSLGSTMRGQSAGAAQRGIQAGQQGIQRGLAGDQQLLQAQEQQAAQSMLAQLLAQQQGQDITQAQGMAQGVNQGNAMNQAMQQFYSQGGLNSALGREQTAADRLRAQYGFDLEGAELTKGLIKSGTGALTGLVGTLSSIPSDSRTDQKYIDDAFNG